MVLFKEDEKRLREQEKKEKLAKRSKLEVWLRRLVKIGMVLAFFFFIGLWLLMALGGDSPELKKGIEDYLTQSTGLKAEINEFTHMKFFPELNLEAGKISFRKDEKSNPVMTVGKIRFVAGFFDMMLSRRRMKVLDIQDFRVAPDIAGEHELAIDFLTFKQDGGGEGKPALVLEGITGKRRLLQP